MNYLNTFPGDLDGKYRADDGGPGVYTRFAGGDVWRKTQSITPPTISAATTPTTATSAVSADTGTPGLAYYYRFDNDKELCVRAGTVKQGTVIIPATFKNLPVTMIDNGGFRFLSITEVIIPNSIKIIGNGAFAQDKGLTSITIPSSVIQIWSQAFRGCDNLTSVTFQGTITAKNFIPEFNFPGDLRKKYLDGGPGTYTRPNNKTRTWTKQ